MLLEILYNEIINMYLGSILIKYNESKKYIKIDFNDKMYMLSFLNFMENKKEYSILIENKKITITIKFEN